MFQLICIYDVLILKQACHKKVIIWTTIPTRESQISVSTSTCNDPKHYGFGNLDYSTTVVRSRPGMKGKLSPIPEQSQGVKLKAYARKEIFSAPWSSWV